MSLKTVLLFAVLMCLMVGHQRARAQEVLDLVKAARERAAAGEPKIGRGGVGAVVAEGMVYKALPLSLTLVSVSPRNLPYGAAFVYEVKVKNSGSASIAFPWSAGRIDEGTEPLYAILSLARQDGAGDDWFIGSSGIYGRKDVAGSIKWLKPDEEVIILAEGRLSMLSSDQAGPFLATLPKGLAFRARLSFLSGIPVSDRVSILSENALKLEVLPPRTP